MSCQALRDRLLRGETGEPIDRHLATCPECAGFAARWQAARGLFGERVEVPPPPFFAQRVIARLPGSTEVIGRLALRVLPAALALALAIAWVGLEQAPLPASGLLAEEPSAESLLTYSVLVPAQGAAPPSSPGPGAPR
ncbi:MAG TPA: hypothetical protein VMM92_00125 [Thermoanaerobaculia bacterium]|nr:hypothetical protein [Thermoanaerobaculia bacterium]